MGGTGIMERSVQFAVGELKKNAAATMSDIRKSAPKGTKIYPVIIGMARKQLGMKRGPVWRRNSAELAGSPEESW